MIASPGSFGVYAGTRRVVRALSATELAAHVAGLLADGFRLALVAAHDEDQLLRVVYLFLAGAPDRRVELHVHVDPDDPRLRRWPNSPFPPAASNARWPTCSASSPSGTPPPAGSSATPTGPKTGTRCAATPDRHRTSTTPARSRSAPSKAPASTRSPSARCTPG